VIGRLTTVIIDCPDPLALARFYSELLGWPIVNQDDDWVDVGDGEPRLAFQLAPDHQAPRWPDPAYPQQVHLDVRVEDVAVAEKEVLALGARRLPGEGADFRVYADPAGHPFCLIW
jgi:catechol 2,3-dioxygenase-like lactoylglutathione lyase family enzyme